MADFPRLKTGVTVQYPATASTVGRTHITRFLDGSEQRYAELVQPVRRWTIHLNLLDEEEARTIQKFFEEQLGAYSVFSFEDPFTNQSYPTCSFDIDECTIEEQGLNHLNTTLVIRTVV